MLQCNVCNLIHLQLNKTFNSYYLEMKPTLYKIGEWERKLLSKDMQEIILAYQEENKELEEENKKLKSERDNCLKEVKLCYNDIHSLEWQISDLEKENKKLKERIEELEKEIEELNKMMLFETKI